MSNIAWIWVVLLSVLGTTPVTAQFSDSPLDRVQIRNQMFGHMFTGEYASGKRWAERFNPNMTSVYVEEGQPIHGHMEFQGNSLCFDYPERPDLEGGCFEVWMRGENCFDFYSTRGDASLDQRLWGRNWMARAWIADRPSTCQSDQIS